ncbi:MAG: tagaturonate reductase [Microscillaceae bacterium]|nr:tagaturonate reductase [Microscillaceae bacterium]
MNSLNLSVLAVPPTADYPEKVLQFGTGVLLRGLPDYFIDVANEQGLFQGRVLVVKSTSGDLGPFESQNCLYTLVVQGREKGAEVRQSRVVRAISRVLSAETQWARVLESAQNPYLQTVISNTTEVGICWQEESIFAHPPASFPGKLTAWLYARYEYFGQTGPDTVVIPTELIVDNGRQLRELVFRMAQHNDLGTAFLLWLEQKVCFCNSLVDRIVTGYPDEATARAWFEQLGYSDQLLTLTEPYRLWAIEAEQKTADILTFAQSETQVVITSDIRYYRERKLRLLNGGHTIAVCRGFLRGLNTVQECMQEEEMANFFSSVLLKEISPTLETIPTDDLDLYAHEILERFRNPFLAHQLLDITLQCTSKMRLRNVPTFKRYFEKYGHIPALMAEGFAYYLFFMKAEKVENGHCFGKRGISYYPIRDEAAPYFATMWQRVKSNGLSELTQFVKEISQNERLWGEDLSQMKDWVETVSQHLTHLLRS